MDPNPNPRRAFQTKREKTNANTAVTAAGAAAPKFTASRDNWLADACARALDAVIKGTTGGIWGRVVSGRSGGSGECPGPGLNIVLGDRRAADRPGGARATRLRPFAAYADRDGTAGLAKMLRMDPPLGVVGLGLATKAVVTGVVKLAAD